MNEFLYFIFGFICANAILLGVLWVKFASFKVYQNFENHSMKQSIYRLEKHNGITSVLFLSCLLFASCTTPRSYNFAKYALNTGLDIAEEAGAFKERTFVFPAKWQGDTLIFYQGVNKHLLVKQNNTYVFTFTPSRQNMQDTCLYYLNKKLHDNSQSTKNPAIRR